MRPMMAWAHDLRCTPTSLANKNPAADNSRRIERRKTQFGHPQYKVFQPFLVGSEGGFVRFGRCLALET